LFASLCYLAFRCVLQLVLLRLAAMTSRSSRSSCFRHELSVLRRQTRRAGRARRQARGEHGLDDPARGPI